MTRLTMTLTYGGNLWTGAVLQRVLDDHVERGAAALRCVAERTGLRRRLTGRDDLGSRRRRPVTGAIPVSARSNGLWIATT